MSTVTDVESGQGPQGAQAAPHLGALLSSLSLSPRLEVLMDYDEGVGGSDSAPPVREAVERTENPDEFSSSACCCIPSGVFRSFTSTRGGINNERDHVSDTAGDQPTQAGQPLSQAEVYIRAYFFHDCRHH